MSTSQPTTMSTRPTMNVLMDDTDEPGCGMNGTVSRHAGAARYQTGAEATMNSEPTKPTTAASTNRP